jgi:thioredoxin 1
MAGQTVEVTMQNFDQLVESSPILILDFWAEWCGPCKMFGPIFEQAAGVHPDIVFGKVDTEQAQDLAAAFQIRSIPTVLAFKEKELVFEQAGLLPAPMLAKLVEELQKLNMDEVRKKKAEAESANS